MESNVVELSGVKIHQVNLSKAINIIENFIKNGQRHQVCVTNTYCVVAMQRDEEFRKINNSSSLVVADGVPLVWVSKLYGQPVPERIAGADLFYGLCKLAVERKYKFFFLGSTQDTLNRIDSNLKKQFPGLEIAGMHSPPYRENFSEAENREMIDKINRHVRIFSGWG